MEKSKFQNNNSETCPICGNKLELICIPVISDELAQDWNLTVEQRKQFDYREGYICKTCGASTRYRNLGKAILETLNKKYCKNIQFFKDIADVIKGLRIAEINNCGPLHKYLNKIPNLYYSEYGSVNPKIKSENLMNLTYKTGYFDLVLMSDVLEHIPDYIKALQEIKRVLRADGLFIFTVPWLPDRNNISRINLKESYHGDYNLKRKDYLVFHEFGRNFLDDLQRYFQVFIYPNNDYANIITSVFICKNKKEEKI